MPPSDAPRGGLLRRTSESGVRPVELFFDLVYVLAVTQLTHYLLEHLSWRGAGETLLLLLAVWVVWIHITWITNYLDRQRRPVQLLMIVLAFGSLVMSASLPEAFRDRGLAFAVALVSIQLVATLFHLIATRGDPLQPIPVRVLVWLTAIGVLWIVGGLVTGDLRAAVWLLAVVASYVVMWFGFPVPGLGRARSSDYTITGEHMAHRSYLFIIIALGESILIIGTETSALPVSAGTAAAFTAAFVGTAALWWIYFDRAEEAAVQVIASAADPGRLGLSAYTYLHIPMVAGIVIHAAGSELTIEHPGDPATLGNALLILGGPALFLIGHALFKQALWRHVAASRLVAAAVLVALVPLAPMLSNLALTSAAALVLVMLSVWELRSDQRDG